MPVRVCWVGRKDTRSQARSRLRATITLCTQCGNEREGRLVYSCHAARWPRSFTHALGPCRGCRRRRRRTPPRTCSHGLDLRAERGEAVLPATRDDDARGVAPAGRVQQSRGTTDAGRGPGDEDVLGSHCGRERECVRVCACVVCMCMCVWFMRACNVLVNMFVCCQVTLGCGAWYERWDACALEWYGHNPWQEEQT